MRENLTQEAIVKVIKTVKVIIIDNLTQREMSNFFHPLKGLNHLILYLGKQINKVIKIIHINITEKDNFKNKEAMVYLLRIIEE